MLQSMGSQTVGHDQVTELNLTDGGAFRNVITVPVRIGHRAS